MGFLAPIVAFIAENAATIGAIATVAGTGFTVGETLSHQGGGATPSATAPGSQSQQQAQANAVTQAEQKAAIARQFPNLQEQLGGAVAPDYLINEASTIAGAPGQTNVGAQAFQQFLGDKSLTASNIAGLNSPTVPSSGGGAQNFWENIPPELLNPAGGQQPGLVASGGNA